MNPYYPDINEQISQWVDQASNGVTAASNLAEHEAQLAESYDLFGDALDNFGTAMTVVGGTLDTVVYVSSTGSLTGVSYDAATGQTTDAVGDFLGTVGNLMLPTNLMYSSWWVVCSTQFLRQLIICS